ncbi:glycosyltransferase family A protein [Ahrensia marina]|uniref:glycosyltransferase n=1 Tax=Ahrensia marina TaxID=1514904 RepID=UPI0035D12ED1
MRGEQIGVSCLCRTYGRTGLLEEAIQSFLVQDYPGPKELIILNDLDAQELRFPHQDVTIVNVRERYPTLGDKCNALVELARFDVLSPWDDDDISLPWRLSTSLARLRDGYFKPRTALFSQQGFITGFRQAPFHAQSCFQKDLWQAVGGYPPIDVGEDTQFETRLRTRFGISHSELTPAEHFYIYRWRGDGHVSDTKTLKAGLDCYEVFDQNVRNQIKTGEEPEGLVELKPAWRTDYVWEARLYNMGLGSLVRTNW